jgi:pyruvate/2-oxoglutarate dehydrogenase complex dihydrolipoamide dehydrogenase (E3) component
MAERTFDVVVVGAGPAGEVAAGRLGEAGLRVALVEQQLVGGECSFYACMPSKALLRPGQLLAETQRVPGVREAVTGQLAVEAVLRRRDEVIHGLDDGSQLPWIEERGIALVRGRGVLDGERRVRVGDDVLVAEQAVVLAVGSRASLPPVEGLAESSPWTNREATTAQSVPPSLLVLGGGVAGCELGQAYATLGSQVTVVEVAPRLLLKEEPFAGEQVHQALTQLGARVQLGIKPASVRRDDDGFEMRFENGSALRAAQLLVSAGRTPPTGELGLETVGVEPGKGGFVEVDDQLRVPRAPWLFVVGDANGRALLTHIGKHQARIAADVIRGRDVRLRDAGPPPRVVFTEPQVTAVGHTLQSARDAGLNVRCVDYPVKAVAGSSFVGRGTPGTARLVIDEDARVLVGATFTGTELADTLHAATIAVTARVSLDDLWHAVPSFPTRSEVWLRLLEVYGL